VAQTRAAGGRTGPRRLPARASRAKLRRSARARGGDAEAESSLHRGSADVEAKRDAFPEKGRVCEETNPERVTGGVADALRGADVCIASRAPGVIEPGWVRSMARDAVVFACANPVPEIWPWDAAAAAG
jgi:malate dehydrogenase (oxaloacetate-decarboxylating)